MAGVYKVTRGSELLDTVGLSVSSGRLCPKPRDRLMTALFVRIVNFSDI
jgi:hypothetical protein